MTVAMTAVVAVAVAVLLFVERRSPARRRIPKMVAATGFVAVGVAAGAFEAAYGRVILVALAAGWAGDLLLTFDRLFRAGLVAFLAGHLAYVGAFSVRGVTAPEWYEVVTLAAIAIAAVRWLWPYVPSAMKLPVAAYIVVITAMVVAALATTDIDPDWRIRLGAVLFFASDLLVARNRFVVAGAVNRIVGSPLYFAGQVLLALSVG